MYKVVRRDGLVIAYGPDEEWYEPALQTEDVLTIESSAPAIEESISEKRQRMVCSRLQAMLALMQSGLLDAAEQQFAAATPTQQLAWQNAQDFYRISPMLVSMGAALGLTDTQLDDLFIAAMAIQV